MNVCSGIYRPLEATQSEVSVYNIDEECRPASRVRVKRPKNQVKPNKLRKEGQNTFIYLTSRCFLCTKRVGPELWRTFKVVPA